MGNPGEQPIEKWNRFVVANIAAENDDMSVSRRFLNKSPRLSSSINPTVSLMTAVHGFDRCVLDSSSPRAWVNHRGPVHVHDVLLS